MRNKNELIVKLTELLKQNKTNNQLAKELTTELYRKGKVNSNLTGALFNGLKEIIDLDEEELILVSKVFYNHFKQIELKPSEYFSTKRLTEYELHKETKEDIISEMEFDNVIKINDTSYICFLQAQKIYEYMSNSLIIYDRRTQREPKIRLLGKNYLIKQINVNKESVKEISSAMRNNKYEPDTIILNVLNLQGKELNIRYNETERKLFIKPNLNLEDNDTTITALIDGFHRVSALIKVVEEYRKDKKKIPEDLGLIAKITVRTLEEAKSIVVQSFKRSQTSEDYLKSLEVNDYTKLADAFISELNIKDYIYPTYNECVFSKGISYKTLIAETLKYILPKDKNFLFNLNIVKSMSKSFNSILSYIIEEYYNDLSGCINGSKLLKINSLVYWITLLYELYKANIEESKYIEIADRIILYSGSWNSSTLEKKKVNVKEIIEEIQEEKEMLING